MKNMGIRLIILVVSFFLVFFCSHFCTAAGSTDNDEVYKKFFTAIGIEAQYNQMINMLISQYQQSYTAGVQNSIKKLNEISDKDKAEIQKAANESMTNFLQKLKAKMNEIMPFQELEKNVYLPMYKKHFTVDEIKEITAFYERETGKKFISLTPTLMQESLAIYNRDYNQKLMQAGNELAETEFSKVKEVEEEIKNNEPAGQAKKTPAK